MYLRKSDLFMAGLVHGNYVDVIELFKQVGLVQATPGEKHNAVQSTSVRNGEAGRPSLLKRFTSGTFAQP